MSIQCPKCQYRRQLHDEAIRPDICPKCGIVYNKYLARQKLPKDNEHSTAQITSGKTPNITNLKEKILANIFYIPEKVRKDIFYARLGLLIAFTAWGLYFITAGVDWEKIGSSFMHNINLPFHEFGHILFMPFGDFMMILGGSLFQILLPFGLTLVFILKQRDNFAGSITLWWCGQSFIDLSPYIADAQDRSLPLVGGGGEESHDWGNLLSMLDSLEHTTTIAKSCFFMGSLIIILALLWGGWILKMQKRNLVDYHFE